MEKMQMESALVKIVGDCSHGDVLKSFNGRRICFDCGMLVDTLEKL